MFKMKKRLKLIVLICFSAAAFLIVSSCREDTGTERVYIIIIDGLRPDRFTEADTPNLDRMIAYGAFTDRARAAIPTQTRVNFVTIPTGARADRHLVFGGIYRDENWQTVRTDGPTIKEAQQSVPVPTVFEVLEDRGIKTAYFVNKGYELVGGRGASIQVKVQDLIPSDMWGMRYNDEINGSRELALENWLHMDNVLMNEAIEILKEEQIKFFIMNLGANDYVGHKLGPMSDEYLITIENADRLIGNLMDFLHEKEWHGDTAVIVGSDHGFTQVGNHENVIMPAGTRYSDTIRELEEEDIVHNAYGRGGMGFAVYLKNPQEDLQLAFEILDSLPYTDRIYTLEEIPEAYGTLSDIDCYAPGYSGELFVDLNPDYTLNFDNRGQHGSTRDDDVVVPFIMYGRNIKSGVMIDTAENADMAPTSLALFGIDHRDYLEAQGRIITEALER